MVPRALPISWPCELELIQTIIRATIQSVLVQMLRVPPSPEGVVFTDPTLYLGLHTPSSIFKLP